VITPNDIKTGKQKVNLKLMIVGANGSGKTHFAATFPKCYFFITEPECSDTFTTKPELLKNIVGWDSYIPTSPDDTKRVFVELKANLTLVRKLIGEGKIETVVVDNLTLLALNRMLYIETHTKPLTEKANYDKFAAYKILSDYLYRFILMEIQTLPCNVVVNVQEKLESEEAMEKKPDKTMPLVPDILGGFRNTCSGLFSCVFRLSKKKVSENVYKYLARTNKGSQFNAKNRYGLPEVIEDVDYAKIIEAVNKAVNPKPVPERVVQPQGGKK